ncbi:MAG: response regulator [Chloroflexi bacterium]|nr:response regulator [Chloroflexota bacterium]
MFGVHALIIEDNQDSITVLGQLLRGEGATYSAVTRPSQLSMETLDAASVIFLDLDMPEMNGYQVFKMLRGEYGIAAPIIAYTVNTNEKATTRQLGFDGMLAKPVDGACFHDQWERILAGESIWDDC